MVVQEREATEYRDKKERWPEFGRLVLRHGDRSESYISNGNECCAMR